MSVFKAYDIRGIYGEELTEDLVYKVGFLLPSFLNAPFIVVGHDIRLSSDSLAESLIKGITDAGADVYDLGLTTTPAVYFATEFYHAKGSVQITASHNPKEYNGLKISREHVLSLGGDSGDLKKLEQSVLSHTADPQNHKKGRVLPYAIKADYLSFFFPYIGDFSALNIGMDLSNGVANLYIKDLLNSSKAHVSYICDQMDGHFPCHEPNPLIEKNCAMLQDLVVKNHLDLGLIFDGDADRVMLIDENGHFVRPDILIAALASFLLPKHPGATVVVDIRTSRAVINFIEKLGGKVVMWRVGHAYAIEKMAQVDALFGGELAGHYYFKDFYYCDSGIFAALLFLQQANQLKQHNSSFGEFVKTVDIYHNSGEINFVIDDKDAAISALKAYATQADTLVQTLDFDGYRFEYKDWWFNVRKSNTEPYLRLIVEAQQPALYAKRLEELKAVLQAYTRS